jgi:pentapeptide MXKDX repeat protein
MTSKLKIALVATVGFAVASFGSVALAEDTVSTPDAMSSNHMSSDHMSTDHMGGAMKKPTMMKHDAMKQMTNEGAMSTDHMAPDAGKQ